MIRHLAIALPLILAPLSAAAQDAFALTEKQERDLRCGLAFALAERFAQEGVPGFKTHVDTSGIRETFFVDTMIGISQTNNLEATALMPLVEENLKQFSDDPALVLAALPGCLTLLGDPPTSDTPPAKPRTNI